MTTSVADDEKDADENDYNHTDVTSPPPELTDRLMPGDARDVLPELPSESIQLTMTSPPYNIGKDYGDVDDALPIEEWRTLVRSTLEEVFRVTKPDGKVVINIGWSFGDRETEGRFYLHPLWAYITEIALDVGFDLWGEVIWNKQAFNNQGGGALMGSYPYPSNFMVCQSHEYVLIFRKWVDEDYYANRELPPLETPRREDSALTKERWREVTQSIWTFDGHRHQDKIDVDHRAVFPEELPKRAIEMFSFKGDTVLDPFLGTGTTAVAAKRAGRHYVGCDLNKEYVEYARDRVAKYPFNEDGYTADRWADKDEDDDSDTETKESNLDQFSASQSNGENDE